MYSNTLHWSSFCTSCLMAKLEYFTVESTTLITHRNQFLVTKNKHNIKYMIRMWIVIKITIVAPKLMSEEWNWLSSDADLQLWHLLLPIKHTLKHVLRVKLTANLEGKSIMLGKSNASTRCYILYCSVAVSFLQSFSFWFHFVATPDYMLVKGGYKKEPPWPNKGLYSWWWNHAIDKSVSPLLPLEQRK